MDAPFHVQVLLQSATKQGHFVTESYLCLNVYHHGWLLSGEKAKGVTKLLRKWLFCNTLQQNQVCSSSRTKPENDREGILKENQERNLKGVALLHGFHLLSCLKQELLTCRSALPGILPGFLPGRFLVAFRFSRSPIWYACAQR